MAIIASRFHRPNSRSPILNPRKKLPMHTVSPAYLREAKSRVGPALRGLHQPLTGFETSHPSLWANATFTGLSDDLGLWYNLRSRIRRCYATGVLKS